MPHDLVAAVERVRMCHRTARRTAMSGSYGAARSGATALTCRTNIAPIDHRDGWIRSTSSSAVVCSRWRLDVSSLALML